MMNNAYLAPVVMFGFNRPDLFESLLKSLVECNECPQTDLFIFIDGPRTEEEKNIQKKFTPIINQFTEKFLSVNIIKSTENNGLRNSLINGVTNVLTKYNSVIILEDDLIVSNNFLSYMNKSLNYYYNNQTVASVSGYTNYISNNDIVDNYFHIRPCSWGWATWKNRWDVIDWDYKPASFIEWFALWFKCKPASDDIFRMFRDLHTKKNNSWAISWTIDNIRTKKLTSYPYVSKVKNVGFGDEATHCKSDNPFITNFEPSSKTSFNLLASVKVKFNIVLKFNLYFSNLYKILFKLGFRLKSNSKGQK